MTVITIHRDFGAQENKICHCFHFPPIYLPWSGRTRCYDLSFLNIDFNDKSEPVHAYGQWLYLRDIISSGGNSLKEMLEEHFANSLLKENLNQLIRKCVLAYDFQEIVN